MTRLVGALLLGATLLVGCADRGLTGSSIDDGALSHALPTHPPESVCDLAAITGALSGSPSDPWLLWVIRADGSRANILWSAGYVARFDPSPELVDAQGNIVAVAGEQVTLGGSGGPGPTGQSYEWNECGGVRVNATPSPLT